MTFDDPFDRYRSDTLRASDAEREQAADALRRHHTDGRLTDDEFEQRVSHCYQARTVGELDRLLADLPRGDRDMLRRGPGSPLAGPGRGLPLPVLVLGGLVALWVVGSVLGALFSPYGGYGGGPGHFHHFGGPPLFVPLLIAFVAWRWIARRRSGGVR